MTEYEATLTAKYGAPIEDNGTYGWTWGHILCRKRQGCPPQQEYLEFRSRFTPNEFDKLVLADPIASGRRSKASNDAAEASRLVGKPKF